MCQIENGAASMKGNTQYLKETLLKSLYEVYLDYGSKNSLQNQECYVSDQAHVNKYPKLKKGNGSHVPSLIENLISDGEAVWIKKGLSYSLTIQGAKKAKKLSVPIEDNNTPSSKATTWQDNKLIYSIVGVFIGLIILISWHFLEPYL